MSPWRMEAGSLAPLNSPLLLSFLPTDSLVDPKKYSPKRDNPSRTVDSGFANHTTPSSGTKLNHGHSAPLGGRS